MKTRSIPAVVSCLLCMLATSARSQTADDYVSQGRASLSISNLAAANSSFSNAVVLSPAHPVANVLYGFTRLLVLPGQPVGSNFLSRLAVPVAGRDVFHWQARLPVDAQRILLAPAGVNAGELSAMLRTNILASLIAAEANLAKVTDTNFTLALTAAETRMTAVTLDYGDIQMLRAMLQAAEYFCYDAYSWNLNAQFDAVRGLYTNNQFSIERILKDYPQLLTFATTNDMNAARTALTNGINRYLTASQFIRDRDASLTRLFNVNPTTAIEEQKFRLTLADLKQSINGVTILTAFPHYSVSLPAVVNDTHPVRSLLPVFVKSTFVLGTLPDTSFGGVVNGLSRQQVESLMADLSKRTVPIPSLSAPVFPPGQPFQFPVHVLFNRGYVVETSANLQTWSDDSGFFGLGDTVLFKDPTAVPISRQYYRVEDRTASMPPAANDNFASRSPLSGLGITTTGYNVNATDEPGEPGYPYNSVWWSWTAPVSGPVEVATIGSTAGFSVTIYTGTAFNNLVAIADGGIPFNAVAGTTYQIQVSGGFPAPGGIKLTITAPPVLVVNSPLDGGVFTAPVNIPISASATDSDGTISQLRVLLDDGSVLGGTNFGTLGMIWSNAPPGYYGLQVEATDNLGVTTSQYINVTIHPANDNFAGRISISGASATVTGSNGGATKEAGEPDHGGSTGGSSVWWTWTSPFNGPVVISAGLVNLYGFALHPLVGVYTGTSVSNLVTVASSSAGSLADTLGDPAQAIFTATAGTTYQIAVDDEYAQNGDITLQVIHTQPPTVTLAAPTNGATYFTSTTTNLTLTALPSDPDGSVSRVDFEDPNITGFIGSVSSNPYTLIWSNVAFGAIHSIVARVTDNSGALAYSALITVNVLHPPPPNDNFTNRIVLTGASVSTNGSNLGATRELNEPYHAGYFATKSVWFSWVAPGTGYYWINVNSSSVYYPIAAVYTGSQLGSLTPVNSGVGSGYAVSVYVYVNAGQDYQIAIDDYYNSGGDYTLSISQ